MYKITCLLALVSIATREIHSDTAVQCLHHVRRKTIISSDIINNNHYFIFCTKRIIMGHLTVNEPVVDVCTITQCGQYSQCREVNGQGVCSCLSEYIGSPPFCKPECTTSSECPVDRACVNKKCIDPCPNQCGLQAGCRVLNHSPICSCQTGFTGDPFLRCFSVPRKKFFVTIFLYIVLYCITIFFY